MVAEGWRMLEAISHHVGQPQGKETAGEKKRVDFILHSLHAAIPVHGEHQRAVSPCILHFLK